MLCHRDDVGFPPGLRASQARARQIFRQTARSRRGNALQSHGPGQSSLLVCWAIDKRAVFSGTSMRIKTAHLPVALGLSCEVGGGCIGNLNHKQGERMCISRAIATAVAASLYFAAT